MNIKKIKKILLINILIILIVLIVIAVLLNNKKKKEEISQTAESQWIDTNALEPQDLKSNEEYYVILRCIEDYILDIKNANYYSDFSKYLDGWYIKRNNINYKTIDIKEYREYFSEFITYEIETIKYISKDKVYVFFVYGKMITNENGTNPKEFNLIIKLDYNNYKYSIIPEHFDGMEQNQEILGKLTDKTYNKFIINAIPNKTIGNRYYLKFFYNEYSDIEKSYEMIDDQYKEKRFFNNIENYKKYAKKYYGGYDLKEFYYSYSEIKIPSIENCTTSMDNNYITYIIDDTDSRSYIIKEIAVDKIKIMLDRYTVPTEAVKQYYNELTEEEKVKFNAENIINSLETEYYDYSYEHLDVGVKNDKFKTIEEYKNYISKYSLEGYTKIENENIKKQENSYIYTADLKNEEDGKAKTITINMKLEENMNFNVSFTVE